MDSLQTPRVSCKNNFGDEYCSSLPTLGEAMTDILKRFQCKRIYGIGGDYASNLLKTFENHFEMYPSSNEMHAGFSACADAEISGLGLCLTTYTVGSLPCISAAALAKTEQIPVVFLSGAPGESELSHPSSLHHAITPSKAWNINFDGALEAFAAIGVKTARLTGARSYEQPSIASIQFYELIKHSYIHKEPVFIEVPRDLLNAPVQALNLSNDLRIDCKKDFREHFILSGAELIAKEIKLKLLKAKKPLIFAGERIRFNHALIEKVSSLSKSHRIPIATSVFAKGIFDEFEPLVLGSYNGAFSTEYVRNIVEKEIDYILEISTSICTQDTNTAFATGSYIIERFPCKTTLKGSEADCSDVLQVLNYIQDSELPVYEFNSNKPSQNNIDDTDGLGFHNIRDLLNQLQTEHNEPFIYLPEIGNSFFASFNLLTRKSSLGRSWLTNPWYAAMGTSIPYARVVSQAVQMNKYIDIPVVITGEGGFLFQLNDLIHFQKENLFCIIILMRNDIYQLGKTGESNFYLCSDKNFNTELLIQSFGGAAYKANSVSNFKFIFNKIVSQKKGLHLIEVPCSLKQEHQCNEIQLLNLYIRARSGDVKSIAEWSKIN